MDLVVVLVLYVIFYAPYSLDWASFLENIQNLYIIFITSDAFNQKVIWLLKTIS